MAPTAPAANSSLIYQASIDTLQTLYSNTLVTLIVLSCVLFFSTYLCAFIATYRYAQRHPRALNKESSVYIQRYAPAFYIFLVISGLIELSLTVWLLVQDAYLGNLPNSQSRRSVALLLFCACWTSLTSGTYSVLFLHPRWTEYCIASVGAQALWLVLTLILWIIGAGLLNGALPQLLVRAQCGSLVHCGQIQGVFALAVIITLVSTGGLIVVIWVAKGFTFRIPILRWKPGRV